MATVFLRINQIGWAHVWAKASDYDEGEPSALFFNTKNDPRWPKVAAGLSEDQRKALDSGQLVELEEHGLLADDLGVD
jgi:hypothetical protein